MIMLRNWTISTSRLTPAGTPNLFSGLVLSHSEMSTRDRLRTHIPAAKAPTRNPGEKTGSVIRSVKVDSGRLYLSNFHFKDFLSVHRPMRPRDFSSSFASSSPSIIPSMSIPDLASALAVIWTDLSSVFMRLSRDRASSSDKSCGESRPSPPAQS